MNSGGVLSERAENRQNERHILKAEPKGLADGLDTGGVERDTLIVDPVFRNKGMLSGGWAQGEKSRARFCSQLWLTHMVFALASLAGPPCPGRRKQALMEGSCGQAASSICSANSIKGLRRACPAPKAMAIHLGATPPRSRVPVARVYKLREEPLTPFRVQLPGCSFGNFPST